MLYIGTVSPFPNENVGWNSQIPFEKVLSTSIVDVFMVTFYKKSEDIVFEGHEMNKKGVSQLKKVWSRKQRVPKRVTYILLLQR